MISGWKINLLVRPSKSEVQSIHLTKTRSGQIQTEILKKKGIDPDKNRNLLYSRKFSTLFSGAVMVVDQSIAGMNIDKCFKYAPTITPMFLEDMEGYQWIFAIEQNECG